MGEQAPGAAHAALHLVEHEQNALLVAKRPQIPQERPGHFAHAALAHDRLDHDSGGGVADGSLNGADIAGSDMVEAVDGRAEALEMLGLAAGRDGGERPAVEGALEGDEAVALRRSLREMIAARDLHRALNRLGAGIGEEHIVGEGFLAEPRREPLLPGDAMQIGHMP